MPEFWLQPFPASLFGSVSANRAWNALPSSAGVAVGKAHRRLIAGLIQPSAGTIQFDGLTSLKYLAP